MTRRLLPYGPSAWLVEVEADEVVGYAAAAQHAAHPAVAQVVPGARTVLVELADRAQLAAVGDWLTSLAPESPAGGITVEDTVPIAVVYDGADLATVADACGLTPAEVIARHCAGTYECAFCGFAPGFAYLTGLDPALQLPRRATPRTRVPAGSVAIATTYSAVYPTASPGGWHLLGRTDAVLFDPARAAPALITPGTMVRFRVAGP